MAFCVGRRISFFSSTEQLLLNSLVRKLTPFGPLFFNMIREMPSGPIALELSVFLSLSCVWFGVIMIGVSSVGCCMCCSSFLWPLECLIFADRVYCEFSLFASPYSLGLRSCSCLLYRLLMLIFRILKSASCCVVFLHLCWGVYGGYVASCCALH